MLARYPQPADLDKDGKLDQRPSESISMLRSSPGALRAWRATVECKSINLLNQIPRTHAVRGIQTWARQGRAFSDALPHKLSVLVRITRRSIGQTLRAE